MPRKEQHFEGVPVIVTSVAVRKAGDGLSKALHIEPQTLKHGDVIDVAIRCEVTQIGFKPVNGAEGCLERVHVLTAKEATVIDSDVVRDAIDAQADRIRAADDAAAGRQRLVDEHGAPIDRPELAPVD